MADRVEKRYDPEIRTLWGRGPWQDEPDEITWTDDGTGYRCMIRRNALTGALCGYVSVPPSHPAHGINNECANLLEAHWGITYTGMCDPMLDIVTDWWWFGFHCMHGFDITPTLREMSRLSNPEFTGLMLGDPDLTNEERDMLQEAITNVSESLNAMTSGFYGSAYRNVPEVEAKIQSLVQQLAGLNEEKILELRKLREQQLHDLLEGLGEWES